MYGGFGGVQVIGHKNLDLLQELIANCSLRRLKSEVLDLPPKTYVKEYVELTNKQRALYDQVSEGIAAELNKLDHIPSIMEEITINMRLRQISAWPGMLSTEVQESAKLDRLEELVEQIIAQGDKVVVFSTFKGTIAEAHRRLQKYNPVIVTGDVSDYESNLAKETFQNNPDVKVYIGTWQKCGTGITLTAASYLIFIDTPWTDGEFQQCADRIYRIGQSKPATIITLISKDTYDERVQEILDRKEVLSGYLIDNEAIDHTKINVIEE
jgi:SNF2 family DNA or RNA helicase